MSDMSRATMSLRHISMMLALAIVSLIGSPARAQNAAQSAAVAPRSSAELEQSMTRSPSKRVLEATRETGRCRLRGVVRDQQEMAARSQGERRHEDAVPLCGNAPATMKGIRFRF